MVIKIETIHDFTHTEFKAWLKENGYIEIDTGKEKVNYEKIKNQLGINKKEVQRLLSGNDRKISQVSIDIKKIVAQLLGKK